LGGRQRDYYTDATMAPVEWWDDLKIKEILIVGGGYELLLPFIGHFVENLKVSCPHHRSMLKEPTLTFAPRSNS
jgi:hypothetical protein